MIPLPTWPVLYDFRHFYVAASCLQRSEDPYGRCFIEGLGALSPGDGSPPRFFPLSVYLFYPSAWFPPAISGVLFVLIMGTILFHVVRALGHRRDLFSALAFFPTSKALYFGQISPIFLWVWSFVSAERTSSAARGLALSLGVLKPNLFIPIALFLTLIDREPRTLLIAFICGVILQVALCWLVFPGIFDAFVAPEAPWLRSEFLGQPTVNRFLFPFLGFDVRWAWFMMVCGSVALWAVIRRRRGQHDIPQVLAPIACLGAPYLWAHDLLICLPLWLAVVRGHPSSILRVVSDLGMISATVVFLYGGFFVEASAIVIPVLLAYYALAVVPKGRAR